MCLQLQLVCISAAVNESSALTGVQVAESSALTGVQVAGIALVAVALFILIIVVVVIIILLNRRRVRLDTMYDVASSHAVNYPVFPHAVVDG